MVKARVEVKRFYSDEYKKEINGLFVDGNLFDWSVDVDMLIGLCANPALVKSAKGDIARHFTTSLGACLGREITLTEINEAIKNGYIEVEP